MGTRGGRSVGITAVKHRKLFGWGYLAAGIETQKRVAFEPPSLDIEMLLPNIPWRTSAGLRSAPTAALSCPHPFFPPIAVINSAFFYLISTRGLQRTAFRSCRERCGCRLCCRLLWSLQEKRPEEDGERRWFGFPYLESGAGDAEMKAVV